MIRHKHLRLIRERAAISLAKPASRPIANELAAWRSAVGEFGSDASAVVTVAEGDTSWEVGERLGEEGVAGDGGIAVDAVGGVVRVEEDGVAGWGASGGG